MMKTFNFEVVYGVSTNISVEAENLEEAKELALSQAEDLATELVSEADDITVEYVEAI